MQARGADGAGDYGSGRKATGAEVSVSIYFPLDNRLFGFKVAFDRSILADCEASFRVDVAGNGSVEDEIGGTIQIAFDLDVAGKMTTHGMKMLRFK